jgi:hypothetical protein
MNRGPSAAELVPCISEHHDIEIRTHQNAGMRPACMLSHLSL